MNPATPVITGALLPLALAFIMLYLGMTLRVADFRDVARRPRALSAGLAGQLLMVPLVGWLIARTGHLDPTMAVGLMVLAACPGGVSSGLLTHLARGDVALSIALTAITSVVAMVSLPVVVDLALGGFMASGLRAELPLARTVRSVFLLTTVPVAIGMALRAWRPHGVARIEPVAARMATTLFVLIVLATFWSQRDTLLRDLPHIGLACAVLNIAAIGAGWFGGRLAGLARRDAVSVATECGLQNSALGIYVTVELLGQPAMSAPSVVYALLMNVGALGFVWLMRRSCAPAGPPGARAPV